MWRRNNRVGGIIGTALCIFPLLVLLVGGTGLSESQGEQLTKDLPEAAKAGDKAGVERVLRQGTDPKGSRGQRALIEASGRGNLEIVKLLLDHGGDVNALVKMKDCPIPRREPFLEWEYTRALIEAARHGRIEMVKLLLERGANVNAFAEFSALSAASGAGHTKTVKLLLEKGANVNAGWRPGGGNFGVQPRRAALVEAAFHGRLEIVDLLLRRGAEINADYYNTPLSAAACMGHTQVLKLLLETGPAIDARANSQKDAALMKAAWCSRPEAMGILLKHGADPNACDGQGRTPLMSASDSETVKVLLAHGARFDATQGDAETPLMHAAQVGCPGPVKLLLEKGAGVNRKGKYGLTALMYACGASRDGLSEERISRPGTEGKSGERNYVETLKLILKAGAEVDAKNEWGWTALFFAAIKRDAEVVKLLLSAGADPHRRDLYGTTAEEHATAMGSREISPLLSRAQGKMEPPEKGRTDTSRTRTYQGIPCDKIAEMDALALKEILQLFEDELVDLGCPGPELIFSPPTPLKYLAGPYYGWNGTHRGCDVRARVVGREVWVCSFAAQPPEGYAGTYRHIYRIRPGGNRLLSPFVDRCTGVAFPLDGTCYKESMIGLLCDLSPKTSEFPCPEIEDEMHTHALVEKALKGAAGEGNLELVTTIIEKGADIETPDRNGRTPLMEAAEAGYPEMVKLFIGRGANVRAADKGEMTVLMHAARGNSNHKPDVVKLLLKHGADVNARDSSGRTALHYAVADGNPEVPLLLLNQGADLSAADDKGSTVLHEAAWGNHVKVSGGNRELVMLLIERGAEVNRKDRYGETPLMTAAKGCSGSPDVAHVLISNGADVNARSAKGFTALMSSIIGCDDPKMVSLLLDHGADVRAEDNNGQTALSFAERFLRLEAMATLLTHRGKSSQGGAGRP
ncbi:MAG: ankyrin repeat domain-containing protein [Thermodesulfobacteriota bacterium]